MFEYDVKTDQYVKVDFDEFSESEEEEEEEELNPTDTVKSLKPLLVLRKQRRKRTVRTSVLFHFHLSRIVRKSGRINTFLNHLPHKNLYYIKDLGNTLLTLQWRWILTTLCLVYFACFILFSWLWMFLAGVSGDFDKDKDPAEQSCIVNARSFTGYLLLSIETMTTIGYGYRFPTEHCTGGWVLLMLQSMFNIVVQGALVSAVYVKTSKPFTKSSSLFSKKAVCLRDGKLCFIFRIHDFSRKIWCGTNISLYYLDKEQNSLEEDFEMIKMTTEPHGLLIFPLEIEHVIDEDSPLWKFRPLEFLHSRFEIVAVAEGSSTITGQASQNRTSYCNEDIMWGHRFLPCVDYDETRRTHVVDYKKFKQVVPFDTPLCSARKLAEMQSRLSKGVQENREKLESISEEPCKEEHERIPKLFRTLFHPESVHDFGKYRL
ncbi:G protein-activated inward rectifier potassium channel 2-like isoform X2 [Anthonomus grandis grandis]|uniref:G protein-activated inward rectifier potassium channel 2-like isoform X2 n=1 Tax=Anthonomus grandis grandis TaxID=2921223 RepID=UPI0021655F1F|nr:G protein-activated inward rectifier potassium channel 2-like isoform X2 [Anthonomus grandis grandis]